MNVCVDYDMSYVSLSIIYTYRGLSVCLKIQEGLAVASIARDDPSPLPGMPRYQ